MAEAKIAALEGAEAAIVTASGMAAISSALLSVLKAGDEVIATRALYGGTYRLMRDVFPRHGDCGAARGNGFSGDRAAGESAHEGAVYRDADESHAAAGGSAQGDRVCEEWDLLALIDNTFASPVLQKPLAMGFDLVLHSATKYLAGHSDVIAGVAAGRHSLIEKIRDMIIDLGGSMDPEAAFLLIRGMKTLELRVLRQCDTALTVARFLEKHPKVARVHYPGLASHPDHRLAKRQMKGFGAMMAFDLKGGLAAARRFCDRTRVFLLAVSLGARNPWWCCRCIHRITGCLWRSCGRREWSRGRCGFRLGWRMRGI